MRCFFHRLPAVIAAGWLALSAGAADMPEPTAKGSLRIGEVLFTVRCFDGNWRNFTQESPAFTVTGRKTEASRFSLEAGFRHAGVSGRNLLGNPRAEVTRRLPLPRRIRLRLPGEIQ